MQTSQNNAKCFCYYARSVVNTSNIKGFFDVLSLRGLKRMFHYWNIGLSDVKKIIENFQYLQLETSK